MLEHARASPGEEVCALLGGISGAPRTFYPMTNTAPDRARRYFIDPVDQIAAMRRMREQGEELVGIFHSHPGGEAVPSAIDLAEAAYPGAVYFIAAPGAEPELRAWHYDGQAFSEITLVNPG